jgi:hypothetical protein
MDTHKELEKLKWDILKRKATNDKMNQTEVPHKDNQNTKDSEQSIHHTKPWECRN